MREDGFLDGEKLSKVLVIKFPILEGLNLPTARLIDYIKLIPIEKMRGLMESIWGLKKWKWIDDNM